MWVTIAPRGKAEEQRTAAPQTKKTQTRRELCGSPTDLRFLPPAPSRGPSVCGRRVTSQASSCGQLSAPDPHLSRSCLPSVHGATIVLGA